MGRPQKPVDATASSPLIRAMQTAYNSAGKPDLRALAKASGVSYSFLYRMLRGGDSPPALELAEKTLATLGYEVQVKYVRPCQVDSAKESVSPVDG